MSEGQRNTDAKSEPPEPPGEPQGTSPSTGQPDAAPSAAVSSTGATGDRPRGASLVIPALAVTLLLVVLLLALYYSGLLERLRDREELRATVADQGAWAWLAFLGVLAVRPFTLFPSIWLAPVTAELFGVVAGALLKAIGETIGATLAFLAARHGLRGPLGALLRRALPRFDQSAERGFVRRLGDVLERKGLRTVLALRFNLLLPFDALNYGLGFTTVKPWQYALGTLLGILPGTFLYVALSDFALAGDWRMALIILAGVALMIWLSLPLARELMRNDAASSGQEGPRQ